MEVSDSGSLFIRIAIAILFTCVLVLFALAAFNSSDTTPDEEGMIRTSAAYARSA